MSRKRIITVKLTLAEAEGVIDALNLATSGDIEDAGYGSIGFNQTSETEGDKIYDKHDQEKYDGMVTACTKIVRALHEARK